MQYFKSPVRIASLALVGIGVGLLALNIFMGGKLNVALPLVFMMLGGVFCIFALAGRERMRWAALAFIPGTLMLALGLVLLLNVLTKDWNAWAYAWLIVVAGVGAGMVLASQGQRWGVTGLVGWCLVGGGMTLSVIFGAIAGGVFIQVMAPILLILGGLSLRWVPWQRILPEGLWRRLHRVTENESLTANYSNYANSSGNKAVSQESAQAQAAPQEGGQVVLSAAPEALVEPLSPRELEVLRLVDQGLTNQQIAEKLSVAPSTVKTHINNIYGKMGVESRVQAVRRAQELKLL